MNVFGVIEPGPFSTVQDSGRFHYRQLGLSYVGPMDTFSFRVGNLLVGNSENEAALEVTAVGPKLLALADTAIALTGADLGFTVNDKPAPMWEVIEIKKGDMIASRGLRKGCRAYVTIAGGIDVPVVMGSKSTHIGYGIGGIEGRALKQGDVIRSGDCRMDLDRIVGRTTSEEINAKIAEVVPDSTKEATAVRVIMGPWDDHFSPDSIKTFLNSDYTITSQADRAGYRLEGPDVKQNAKGPNLPISSALVAGTIQVPGSCKPIIWLHERVAGGYAVIATVISPDLWKLGQLKPGDAIRFQKVDIRQAHSILKEYETRIAQFKSLCGN